MSVNKWRSAGRLERIDANSLLPLKESDLNRTILLKRCNLEPEQLLYSLLLKGSGETTHLDPRHPHNLMIKKRFLILIYFITKGLVICITIHSI